MASENIKNIPPETGDLHNFGKLTTKIQRDGVASYRKFRNLGLEFLFLDKNSPLCSLLENIFPNSFIRQTFNLNVELPLTEHLGYVKEVKGIKELSEIKRTPETYFTVGQQIAYFSSLGFTDLLLENFQICESGLQLIDAECVLGFTTGLEESALLPFLNQIFDGKYGLFPYYYGLEDKDLLGHLIAGYIDGLYRIEENKEEIIKLIDNELKNIKTLPFRSLLRPTAEYDLFLNDGTLPSSPFIDEEITQLKRGDIPYFFKYYSRSEIMYYTTDKFDVGVVNLEPLRTNFNTNTYAKPISQILTSARFQLLLRNGMRSLCKWGSIGTKHSISLKYESFEVSIKQGCISLKLSRQIEKTFLI
jgi:lantibiotic modifying enzyme